MRRKNNLFILILFSVLVLSCGKRETRTALSSSVIDSLMQVSSTEGFQPYSGNPVIEPGSEGSWDAGALGSMTVLKVGDTFHIYYEAWGVRTEKLWDALEYETLQIGHATSKDGIHWTKDPKNPVLSRGGEGEWDETGVWDPYVIYEDSVFKMWYGGGGGRKPNWGWAFAVSKDGSSFEKKGLIGTNNQSDVEDAHVVHDKESGFYYLYYWHPYEEGEALFCATSPTDTGFDFSKSAMADIEGDSSFWKKFGQVLKNEEGWHMFYSNYIPPYGRESIVRYATSEDGIHWQAKNKGLLYGLDADVMQVDGGLYLMAYGPKNHFDRKDADIRIAVYNGKLSGLASKPSIMSENEPASIAGKKFTIELGEEGLYELHFKSDGEVVVSDEVGYSFNAVYKCEGENVHIMGEDFELEGTYDGQQLQLKKQFESEK